MKNNHCAMRREVFLRLFVNSQLRGLSASAALLLGSSSLLAQSLTPAVTNVWRLPAGVPSDFAAAADGLVRGVAINPVNGNVIYASRNGGNHPTVVDGTSGTVISSLSGNGVSGGTLALGQVKVTEDGVIYAANLAAATSTLKLYRWDSDSTLDDPLNVFTLAGVTTRYGDTMDLRGYSTNAEIIISGSGGNKFALLTTTNGYDFSCVEFALPTGVSAGDIGKGICFDGTRDAFFAKKDGSAAMRYVTFDRAATNSTLVTSGTTHSRLVGLDFAETNGFKVAAGVLYGSGTTLQPDQHRAHFWDITSTNAPQLILDDPLQQPNPTYIANGNAIGAADGKNGRLVVLEPNNGIALYQLYVLTNPPPSITSEPVGSTNILTGGFYTLTVGASGSGLRYQWYLNSSPLPAKTNAWLALTNLAAADGGSYTVVITNAGGAVTSRVAEISLLPSMLTAECTKLWQLTPGSRTYLTTDNNQRGLAYNPVTKHLILVNRAGGASVNVLDAATGTNISTLNMTGVGGQAGETFPVLMAGVAEDGVIYVCNLSSTGDGSGFTIYRWADESPATTAAIAYGPGNPVGQRIGDALSVIGSGVNTRLLASARNGTQVVVFTTTDGFNFTANIVDVITLSAGFAGLGLAAGPGDTFWATSSGGFPLVKVLYNLTTGASEVQLSLSGPSGFNIALDPVRGLVANIGTEDTPSNLRLIDVATGTSSVILLDQEFFGADNDNLNGTGSVAFDVAGGRVFALDTNNGLIALNYGLRLYSSMDPAGMVLSWNWTGTLQSSTSVTGVYSDVTSTSPHTNAISGNQFFRVRR